MVRSRHVVIWRYLQLCVVIAILGASDARPIPRGSSRDAPDSESLFPERWIDKIVVLAAPVAGGAFVLLCCAYCPSLTQRRDYDLTVADENRRLVGTADLVHCLSYYCSCFRLIRCTFCRRLCCPDAGRKPRGVVNRGNTCYFNATIQCLTHTPILRRQIERSRSTGTLTSAFVEFNRSMHIETTEPFTPYRLLGAFYRRAARFDDGQQHDSHEFLRHFLDGLRDEERPAGGGKWNGGASLTAVDRIFGGHQMTVYACKTCGTPYHLCEPMVDISLPVSGTQESVPDVVAESVYDRESNSYRKAVKVMMERLSNDLGRSPAAASSIDDCLRCFTRREAIDDQYLCNTCNSNAGDVPKMTSATKQTLIFSPPAVLTVHLKRFEMTGRGFEKRRDRVSFGETIDIAPYCSSWLRRNDEGHANVWYSLYGVVVHLGSGLESGHYVAYVKVGEEHRGLEHHLQREYFDRDVSPEELVRMMHGMKNRSVGPVPRPADKAGTWFRMDDSTVKEEVRDEVLRAEAFLLFYERV